mgnify:CR=1 FL=1
MKNRILFISSQAYSLLNFRGTLIVSLIEDGWEVHCVATDMSVEIQEELKLMGAVVHKLEGNRAKFSIFSDMRYTFQLYNLIKNIKPSTTFCYFMKPIIFGSLVAKMLEVDVRIILIEGLGYIYTEEKFFIRRLVRPLITLAYNFAVRFSTKVIVLNSDDRDFVECINPFGRDKVVVIPGIGVDLEKFYPHNKHRIISTSYDFAYFGRMLKHKGILNIIEAIKILKTEGHSCRVAFFGSVDENPSSLSLQQLKDWECEGLITYQGFSDNVVKDMLSCNVILLPSYREALPRTCQEAAVLGKAAIVSNAIGCREVVVDNVTGLVCEVKNSQSLAQKMKFYLLNQDIAIKHGANARSRAVSLYDAKNINRQFIKIINLKEKEIDKRGAL